VRFCGEAMAGDACGGYGARGHSAAEHGRKVAGGGHPQAS
jgi:hypothetical protein